MKREFFVDLKELFGVCCGQSFRHKICTLTGTAPIRKLVEPISLNINSSNTACPTVNALKLPHTHHTPFERKVDAIKLDQGTPVLVAICDK